MVVQFLHQDYFAIIIIFFLLGLHPSQAKLELQRHLASLDNHEQASVFENTKVCACFSAVLYSCK